MKAGRNEPCPCGSGKKYKKCCLLKEYREASDPVEEYKADLSNVIETATHFAGLHFRTEMEKAIEDFVGPDDPGDLDDVAMMSFADYFLLDHRLSDGGTIFDHFVERRGTKLSALEQKMLNPLQESHISLFEVQSVDRGRGFRVKEAFTEQEHWIPERRPTESLVIWTLIATRIIRVDDVSLMVRSGIPFQPMEKPLILNALSGASRGRFPKRPAARKKFFRHHGEFFFQYHLQRKRQLARPVLMTMENERMVLVDIHYQVLDWEKTIEALEGIEEFTPAESVDNELVFDWVVPHEMGPLQNILRGTITLTPTRMIARCRSRERAEKVKKIIQERLRGFVKHQMDRIQDIYQALEEYKDKGPVETSEEIPMEVQNQLIGEMLERHYSRWVDKPLPALKNHTPRQAAKDPKLYPLLECLLKDIEYQNELDKRVGKVVYEVARIKRELGLL